MAPYLMEGCRTGAGPCGLALACLLAIASPSAAQDGGRAAPPAAEASWDRSFASASEEAARDGRPIFIFFPSPARPGDVPAPLRDQNGLRLARKRAAFARAQADDAAELRTRYGVKTFPAVVLLDRRGAALDRWEGVIPLDFWPRAERAMDRLLEEEKSVERAVSAARAAVGRDDFPAALAAIREARTRARSPRPELEEAARLEKSVLDRAAIELRKALAAEGLIADRELLKALESLRSKFPHPAVAERVGEEAARVRSRQIAGRKEPRG